MIVTMVKKKCIIMIGMLVSISCVANLTADQLPKVMMGYINPPTQSQQSSVINNIRLTALRETASSLGARGGLAWQAEHINNSLKQQAAYLNKIFNFQSLLIDNKILPPILQQGGHSTDINSSGNALRIASKTYQIVSPARFVVVAPTWRNYLWLNFNKPTVPDKSLLPVNSAEVSVWNDALQSGWKQGIQQANEIFTDNLNRLKRDYKGVILYKELLDKHLVNAPQFAQTSLGVTGNSNEMRINDQVLRITKKSALQIDKNKWTPVVVVNDGGT